MSKHLNEESKRKHRLQYYNMFKVPKINLMRIRKISFSCAALLDAIACPYHYTTVCVSNHLKINYNCIYWYFNVHFIYSQVENLNICEILQYKSV